MSTREFNYHLIHYNYRQDLTYCAPSFRYGHRSPIQSITLRISEYWYPYYKQRPRIATDLLFNRPLHQQSIVVVINMYGHNDGNINEATMVNTPGGQLRRRLASNNSIIVAPGVYDGFSARIALEVGYDCLYMTGAGTAASKLGQPDLGFTTQSDMRENAEMIANLDPNVPLIADADTGFGGPAMVARTVAMYHRSGVAALHIEDQIQTKRCGHLGGKEVVSLETFVSRITAAKQARDKIGSDMVVIARTDALQTHDFDEAIRRLRAAFVAGADVAFLEGLTSLEQCRKTCELLAPKPVLLNMVEFGATPSITPQEAQDLGFKIIIFPFAAIAPAYEAIKNAMTILKKTGKTGIPSSFTPKKLFTVVGLEDAAKIDGQAGGSVYDKV